MFKFLHKEGSRSGYSLVLILDPLSADQGLRALLRFGVGAQYAKSPQTVHLRDLVANTAVYLGSIGPHSATENILQGTLGCMAGCAKLYHVYLCYTV
jgi:hypothetical protein